MPIGSEDNCQCGAVDPAFGQHNKIRARQHSVLHRARKLRSRSKERQGGKVAL